MSTSWEGGSTRRWRKIRQQVLDRDGHTCLIALPGEWINSAGDTVRCLGRATHAHHTLGRSVTGDDPRYCVAACEPCNLKVGDPTDHDPLPQPRTQW